MEYSSQKWATLRNFKDKTFIYDYSGKPQTIQAILNLMGYSQNQLYHRSEPNNPFDILIVLGADWVQENTLPETESDLTLILPCLRLKMGKIPFDTNQENR